MDIVVIDDWPGIASTALEPTPDYWRHLTGLFPEKLVTTLRAESEQRVNEFHSSIFGPAHQDAGTDLLDHLVQDGWLQLKVREVSPHEDDGFDHDPDEPPKLINTYVRRLAATRDVDWVVLVHGMNTRGAWQEEFAWYMATTYGRSVPTSIYKYGMIVTGVLLFWRRQKLKRRLHDRLLTLTEQAESQGYHGRPDLIAHSFGTWLIGRILEEETNRHMPQLKFGRLILTGSILRPDFDWEAVKTSGIVDEVLNHFGTSDIIVPLAPWTIPSSGPSGRRGFDSTTVLNVEATGAGHSDFFRDRLLRNFYTTVWRPFLTLPAQELSRLPNQKTPEKPWRALPWPIAGNLFLWVALPAVGSFLVFLLAAVGRALTSLQQVSLKGLAVFGAATLLYFLFCAVLDRIMN